MLKTDARLEKLLARCEFVGMIAMLPAELMTKDWTAMLRRYNAVTCIIRNGEES